MNMSRNKHGSLCETSAKQYLKLVAETEIPLSEVPPSLSLSLSLASKFAALRGETKHWE